MKKETAQKAAKWWADKLRNKSMPDNGDRSETGMITSIFGAMLQHEHTEEDVKKFEDCLADLLENHDKDYFYNLKYIVFGVDYHPEPVLSDAAEKAGVKLSMTDLPWKTNMWIEDDKVLVAAGYGEPRVEL